MAASLTRASSSMAAPAKVRAAKRAAAAELAADSVEYPERPGEPECVFWVKTGRCKFGAGCRFNHPRGTHG